MDFIIRTRKRKGFTIIEMVITVAVISLLSGIVVGYSQRNESRLNLVRAVNQFILDFQRVQHLSMLLYSGIQSDSNRESICGWGIYFTEDYDSVTIDNPLDKYIIFSDICEPSSNLGNLLYDSNEGKEDKNLMKGVVISSINFKSLVFVPPEPTLYFSPDSLLQNVEIQFSLKGLPDKWIKVLIYPTGQITKIVND